MTTRYGLKVVCIAILLSDKTNGAVMYGNLIHSHRPTPMPTCACAEIERRQRELARSTEAKPHCRIAKIKKKQFSQPESGLTFAMSAWAYEEAALKPDYYDLRVKRGGQSDIGAKNCRIYGGAGHTWKCGGDCLRYTVMPLGTKGALTRQEQQAREDIARRRSATQS